jgi:hypothetical protein
MQLGKSVGSLAPRFAPSHQARLGQHSRSHQGKTEKVAAIQAASSSAVENRHK